MEAEVLSKEKGSFSVMFSGLDESLARLAVEEVWQEKDVKIASAVLDHPLTAKPVISIKSAGAKENLESAFKGVEEKAEAAIKAAKAI